MPCNTRQEPLPPLPHLLITGLASLWLPALLPPLAVTIWRQNILWGLAEAFLQNSLLVILFYRDDKFRAQNHFWRTPEAVLHIWELLFGWPGALYAQSALRHKNRKMRFLIVFWLCALLNLTAILLPLKSIGITTANQALHNAHQRLIPVCRQLLSRWQHISSQLRIAPGEPPVIPQIIPETGGGSTSTYRKC